MGGNVELLEQVIKLFRDDAPEILSQLRAAAATNSFREAQRAAHCLKGLVVNFDGEAAALAALRIERLATAGDLSAAEGAIDDLECQIARLLEALPNEIEKFRRSDAPPPTSSGDQAHQEQHEKYEKQQLGNFRGRDIDARKAEQSGDQRDDQKS
jgi:HPt (histidine-containing phosphotransfer) domain-containing protein